MYETKNTERGFFALITVIVVGFLFLFLVLSLAQQGIMGRFMLLDVENKYKSESYAEACVQRARVAVVNDPLRVISTPYTTPVGSGSCTVVSLEPNTPSSGQSRVKVKATVSGATTNFQATINTTTGAVSNWRELYSL